LRSELKHILLSAITALGFPVSGLFIVFGLLFTFNGLNDNDIKESFIGIGLLVTGGALVSLYYYLTKHQPRKK
jgi:hypothetical protein